MEHERCEVCGFDGSRYDDSQILESLRDLGPEWTRLLQSAVGELRARPNEETWSAIEYAAHSRDVTALHVFGVEQAIESSEPVFPEIDGESLIEDASTSYAALDPEAVASELGNQARALADVASSAGTSSWTRGITIGDSRRDVRSLLEHGLHDSRHHLADVQRGLIALRTRAS